MLHQIQDLGKQGLCQFHSLELLKRTCELISSLDDLLLTPHKTKISNQVLLNFLGTSRVQYVPKEQAKLLPRTRLPHQSLVPIQCKLIYYISTKMNMFYNNFMNLMRKSQCNYFMWWFLFLLPLHVLLVAITNHTT